MINEEIRMSVKKSKFCRWSCVGLIGLGLVAAAQAQVTDAMISSAGTDTKEVLTWGISPNGQRFSPLTQINAKRQSLNPSMVF